MSSVEGFRERANALVRSGRIDAAARVLFEAGLLEDAATILADHGRGEDAVVLLCGRGVVDASRLATPVLTLAAKLLETLHRAEEAAAVHERLGNDAKADELRRQASGDRQSGPPSVGASRSSYLPPSVRPPGRPGGTRGTGTPGRASLPPDAASSAAKLEREGSFEEAARQYLAAGEFIAAARCFDRLQAPNESLRALLRVPVEAPEYKQVCQRVVTLAAAIDLVDFDLDHFLSRFLRGSVTSKEDGQALMNLSELYERHGFLENAREALARVAAAWPNDANVKRKLERLDYAMRGSAKQFERAVREDEVFRRVGREAPPPADSSESFPSLPELPPIAPRNKRAVTLDAVEPQRISPPRSVAAAQATIAKPPAARPPSPAIARPAARAGAGAIPNVFDVPAGFVVADRYRVVRCVGRGGMAAVYEVLDDQTEENIALKLFAPTGNDDTQLGRFKQELAVARKLNHNNIVRLYDIGTHGHASFLTMELLEGMDLADLLEQSRDLIRDLGYLAQALEGLQCAHERGVVHRDLKPENIFVTNAGVVKIMDFGIAKQQTRGNLTQAGYSAGTPAYMAPEQASDFRSATHLADLYSVGVIAYRMFTGELPFQHDNPVALLMKHMRDPPAPPSSVDPSIPDELEFMIMQLLEKDPARRIQSCRELADDLVALRNRLQNARRRR